MRLETRDKRLETKKENWEKATDKFIRKWKNKKEVVGALVCGSYVTGNPTKHSDIDINIILDNKCNWRMRGDEYVDGYLMEYLVNPPKQHEIYFKEDIQQKRKGNIHMFLTGKVLFDKTGDVEKLIQSARKWDKKKYKKSNEALIEINKYFLWDKKDNLEEVFMRNKEDFYFVYYNFLNDILVTYSNYLGFDNMPVYKARRFLTEEKDKLKYQLTDYPDKKFVIMYIKAMQLKDKKKMLKEYQGLSKYVLNKMGGFDIDGWEVKTPLSK